uniref:Uncharacterized protein n=1 Tax=uncultured prokaryote TaxID=198431 RepID=A0A0H5Q0Q1_9ZZZZ|nr:hypothetical protein [uncultured prokaryote]
MSEQSNVINFNDNSSMPAGVVSAFNRQLRVFDNSDSFVDRVFYLNEMVTRIDALRYAGVLSGQQTAGLFRQIRKLAQDDLGAVTSESESALDIDSRESAAHSN